MRRGSVAGGQAEYHQGPRAARCTCLLCPILSNPSPYTVAALAGSVSTARVNLYFELGDEDAEERRLIDTAVAKARLGAEALAAAAGTELAGVKEIRYNRGGDSFFGCHLRRRLRDAGRRGKLYAGPPSHADGC